MTRKPVQIGARAFRSQTEALTAIRQIRAPYIDLANRRRVRVTDPEHHAFLADLLMLHSEFTDKIGVGIDHFRVGPDGSFGTDFCFFVYRVDGSSTDFSFRNCVTGASERADRLSALREAIAPQTTAFKQQSFAGRRSVPCAELGTEIAFPKAHVDHMAPSTFHSLVEAWMTARGITLREVVVTPATDNQFVTRMADTEQEASWQAYHREHARLRIVSSSVNLSTARRPRS